MYIDWFHLNEVLGQAKLIYDYNSVKDALLGDGMVGGFNLDKAQCGFLEWLEYSMSWQGYGLQWWIHVLKLIKLYTSVYTSFHCMTAVPQ